MVKSKKTLFLFIIILLIATLLRIHRLPEMASFEFDQEYASNFAYSVIREYPIQLIGQGLSIQGLFMGPLYFYYLVPFYALTDLHPIGGFIGSIILGLITISVYFWVGKQMFGETAGLMLSFLRAFLFSFIEVEWTLTPAFSSDLIAVITLYLLYCYWEGKIIYLIPLGFIFGLYTSFHPILFPFYLVFILLFILKRKIPSWKITIFSLISFLIPITPLLIFEYFHNFLEVKQLFVLFGGNLSESKNYLSSLTNNLQVSFFEPYRIFGLEIIPKFLFSIMTLLIFVYLIFSKVGFWKNTFHRTILALTCIIFIFYYTFYPGHVPEYYFLGSNTPIL